MSVNFEEEISNCAKERKGASLESPEPLVPFIIAWYMTEYCMALRGGGVGEGSGGGEQESMKT